MPRARSTGCSERRAVFVARKFACPRKRASVSLRLHARVSPPPRTAARASVSVRPHRTVTRIGGCRYRMQQEGRRADAFADRDRRRNSLACGRFCPRAHARSDAADEWCRKHCCTPSPARRDLSRAPIRAWLFTILRHPGPAARTPRARSPIVDSDTLPEAASPAGRRNGRRCGMSPTPFQARPHPPGSALADGGGRARLCRGGTHPGVPPGTSEVPSVPGAGGLAGGHRLNPGAGRRTRAGLIRSPSPLGRSARGASSGSAAAASRDRFLQSPIIGCDEASAQPGVEGGVVGPRGPAARLGSHGRGVHWHVSSRGGVRFRLDTFRSDWVGIRATRADAGAEARHGSTYDCDSASQAPECNCQGIIPECGVAVGTVPPQSAAMLPTFPGSSIFPDRRSFGPAPGGAARHAEGDLAGADAVPARC